MSSSSLLLTCLFALGFGLLPALALFILRRNPSSPLHRTFGWACLSLLLWLGTLYAFDRTGEGGSLTLLGRLNYASVLFVVLLAYLFARQVLRRPVRILPLLLGETCCWQPSRSSRRSWTRGSRVGQARTSRSSDRSSSSTRCISWGTWARPSTRHSGWEAVRLLGCAASSPS